MIFQSQTIQEMLIVDLSCEKNIANERTSQAKKIHRCPSGQGIDWLEDIIVNEHGQVKFHFLDCKALKTIFYLSNPCENWHIYFKLFIIAFDQNEKSFLYINLKYGPKVILPIVFFKKMNFDRRNLKFHMVKSLSKLAKVD